MISPQLILDICDELFIDNFAGGGGGSTGIEQAIGRPVNDAINHDEHALGMHRINHPQTIHHHENVWDVDIQTMTGGRPIGGAWFSPDCTHFSKAKGGKPLSKKIRGLVLVMLRYAKAGARVMFMENVEEIQTWGPLLPNHRPDPQHKGRTWKAFLAALGPGLAADHPDIPEILELTRGAVTKAELVRGFGYQFETRELRCCDYGAPTIRKRLFMIARRDGMPIVWPERSHGPGLKPYRTIAECIDWSIPCTSIFLTRKQAKAQGVRCKRPLNNPTMRRIAAGMDRYVLKAKRPFMVSLTHQGGVRIESVDESAKTITSAHRGEKALVAPVLARTAHGECDKNGKKRGRGCHDVSEAMPSILGSPDFAIAEASLAPFVTEHANASNQRNMPADEPMRALCAQVKGGHFAAVAASMIKLRGDAQTHSRGYPVTEPGHVVSAGGQHQALTVAYLAQHNAGFNTTAGRPADEPVSTISSRGSQQQLIACTTVPYYGSEADGQALDESLRSVTSKARFAHVEAEAVHPWLTPEQVRGARRVARFLRSFGVEFEGEFATVCGYVIVDIGMRMLAPRELFRAQGFPDTYIIDRAWLINPRTGELREVTLTKAQQIRMCGNSVPPPVVRAIVAANVPEMSVWNQRELRRFNHTHAQ